jgi:hypothetical protein
MMKDTQFIVSEEKEYEFYEYYIKNKKGKPIHFLLMNCFLEHGGRCKGCGEDTNCDCCNVRLCYYLATEREDELYCPICEAQL